MVKKVIKKGFIEGFYGRFMSPEDRALVLNKLKSLSMDFYIYGPKEDPFHRSEWTSVYPENKAKDLQDLRVQGERLGIRTYMALSPLIGTSDDLNKAHENILKKINQFKKLGFVDFALFFDDVDYERNDHLANIHSKILCSVKDFIGEGNSLIFCPTVYCNRFASGDLSNSSYLKALSKMIPETIPMLWTGKEVVSETIKEEDIIQLKQVINNPIIIWDNYYANDYCPRKLFIGEYQGRSFSEKTISAVGINPTGLPLTDSIILAQVEGSMSTKEILNENNVPECFNKILPFFNGPFDKPAELEGIEQIEDLLKLSSPLCIDWKSELQLEWAPYLWNFFIDLNFLKKFYKAEDQKGLEEWASQRYSNPLSEIIFRNNKDK